MVGEQELSSVMPPTTSLYELVVLNGFALSCLYVLIVSVSTGPGNTYIESDNGKWQFRFSCQTCKDAEIGSIHGVTDKGKTRRLIE